MSSFLAGAEGLEPSTRGFGVELKVREYICVCKLKALLKLYFKEQTGYKPRCYKVLDFSLSERPCKKDVEKFMIFGSDTFLIL